MPVRGRQAILHVVNDLVDGGQGVRQRASRHALAAPIRRSPDQAHAHLTARNWCRSDRLILIRNLLRLAEAFTRDMTAVNTSASSSRACDVQIHKLHALPVLTQHATTTGEQSGASTRHVVQSFTCEAPAGNAGRQLDRCVTWRPCCQGS